jgi:DNA-directed RNA polymerase specialized sigma24 family protein
MNRQAAVQALRRSGRDPEAVVVFYDRHTERLLTYFAKRVFDAEVALDLTAETFAQPFLGKRRGIPVGTH